MPAVSVVVEDDDVWLCLEVGVARSLRDQVGIEVDASSSGQRRGRRALVVEAAHTYFPEAGVEDLPQIAAVEVAAGLTGRLRRQIAACGAEDPALLELRDELIAGLGGSSDGIGALTVVDAVYTGRLLRGQVPPIITASCISWYGYWRSCFAGPALETAEALARCADAWTEHRDQRAALDVEILALAGQLGGDPQVALEVTAC